MSSSRDCPFNFSLDVRDRLGPPDAFNLAVRDAFPVVDPEAILWMQSGHAQDAAARRYVELNSPALLYSTYEAFDL